MSNVFFFFQAEDGIRDLVRSRGLGDVYKRQHYNMAVAPARPYKPKDKSKAEQGVQGIQRWILAAVSYTHLTLPTSDLV